MNSYASYVNLFMSPRGREVLSPNLLYNQAYLLDRLWNTLMKGTIFKKYVHRFLPLACVVCLDPVHSSNQNFREFYYLNNIRRSISLIRIRKHVLSDGPDNSE